MKLLGTFATAVAWLLAVAVPAVGTASDAAPIANRGFLYTVEKGATRAWLYGTVHAGAARIYPLQPGVHRAIEAADALAVEVDVLAPKLGDAMIAFGLLPSGDSLERMLDGDEVALLTATLQKVGIPPNFGLRIKPMLAAASTVGALAEEIGYSTSLAVDAYLLGYAKSRHKPIVEIEGPKRQMQMLADVEMTLQVEFLKLSLEQIRDGSAVAELRVILEAWERGDERALAKSLTDQTLTGTLDEALRRILLTDRNKVMTDYIADALEKRQKPFVAVGALHLAGADGMVAALRSRGFSVERVALAKAK